MKRSHLLLILVAFSVTSFFLGKFSSRIESAQKDEGQYPWDLREYYRQFNSECEVLKILHKTQQNFQVDYLEKEPVMRIVSPGTEKDTATVTILDRQHRQFIETNVACKMARIQTPQKVVPSETLK